MSITKSLESDKDFCTTKVMSLDGKWLIAADPDNVGRHQQWWDEPLPDAKETKVPWIIEDPFPNYEGVVWYWRDFVPPENPHTQGRYLLRFWAVYYKSDIWLNGAYAGEYEGGETPFILDVTDFVKPLERNHIAVRVLKPGDRRIDDMVRAEVPHQQFRDGGGIIDSVELLVTPAVYIRSLSAQPNSKTGAIFVQAHVQNSVANPVTCDFEFSIAPASSGETIAIRRFAQELPSGESFIKTDMQVENPHLWDLKEPFLYRVTARLKTTRFASEDEQSVRCGFRDFRFADGYFRLNGKRIFLRSALITSQRAPIGAKIPHDKEMFRRILLNTKMMGLNMVRYLNGVPRRDLLDLCDEIGLMVYEEPMASWTLVDSPKMKERYDQSLRGMILRDRNHPSVVIWGLLNETSDGPVFRRAVEILPMIRTLDDTRVVLLGSGRWDRDLSLGSFSNPGSMAWDTYLGDEGPDGGKVSEPVQGGLARRMGDIHIYFLFPHQSEQIEVLRTLGQSNAQRVFLSEYGVGTGQYLMQLVQLYEQNQATHLKNYKVLREARDRFLTDWQRWNLAETFGRPEDFFAQSLRCNGMDRLVGLNAIRSNPHLVGHSITALTDNPLSGNGLMDSFGQIKPGVGDAIRDGFAPLRWCLFAEPYNIYRGASIRLEAVLANEDVLPPGDYRGRIQIIGPDSRLALDRTITVTILDPNVNGEPPLAMQVFGEEVMIDGPSGSYRLVASFEEGALSTGGGAIFNVMDASEMPPVNTEVVLWGEDEELADWLRENGIRTRLFNLQKSGGRELILVSNNPASPGGEQAFRDLARRIGQGASAVFLSPDVFRQGEQSTRFLPLRNKGTFERRQFDAPCFKADKWAKQHPIFNGLPAGELMDPIYYRDVIPEFCWVTEEVPTEAVSGVIHTSFLVRRYLSGLFVSVHELGAGRFILNLLNIREKLGRDPGAERLLRNMLIYAGRDMSKPSEKLPDDFDAQLNLIMLN